MTAGLIVLRVDRALAQARERGVERLDAQLMLGRVTGRPRTWLLAHDDAHLSDGEASAYAAMLGRRVAGEPLAYLLGTKEFFGLDLQVNADVLVPRPETETLVEWALELLATDFAEHPTPSVVDLGTGSGAIALAVKHAMPRARIRAVDQSNAALAVARANAARLALDVTFEQSDWWQAIDGRLCDLALSNPPYIALGDEHLPALAHEPQAALVSGADGLDAIRQIALGARSHIEPGGWLLMEHGHGQAEAVRELLRRAGCENVDSRYDLAGIARCSGGRLVAGT